jgi:uncharacterized protein YjbI with pentapeptide repeats
MRIFTSPEPLSVGYMVGRHVSPNLLARFFAKLAWRLQPGAPGVLADEPELLAGDVFEEDNETKPLRYASDFVPVKPKADVLLIATAHAPNKQPVERLDVTLRVGKLSKSLRVFGRRTWKTGLLRRSGVATRESFVSLPLTYAHAVGGPKSKHNPIGIGLEGEEMPRIEEPYDTGSKPRIDLTPVGFGPVPAAWEPRASKIGTYDKKWHKERWPWYANDLDLTYFNAAPADQQVDGYLRGDEAVEFENLHSKHETYKSRLPGRRLRLFVNIRTAEGLEFREVPVKLDTLWIDLNEEKGVLVWRGATEVRAPKMREVEHVLAWTEPLAEPPKPIEHYREVLEQQKNPVEPVIAPPPMFDDAAFEKKFAEMDAEFAKGDALLAAAEAEGAKLQEAEMAAMVKQGLDPAKLQPPPPTPPADVMKAMLAEDKDMTPVQRADLEKEVGEIAKLQQEFSDMEVEFAKEFPAPATRDQILAAIKKGETGRVGARGLDFSGQDLSGADLTGADFTGANLAGANLAHANLTNADLTGADLSGADLSGARLDRADLRKAKLADAKFGGASLRRATLVGLELAGFDLSQVNAESADFAKADLSKAKLVGARLLSADFTGAKLEGADLRGADLTRAALDKVQGKDAVFEGANLSNASLARESDYTGANFRKVIGPGSVFESSVLDGADFSRAQLSGSQFGDASLKKANFDRANLTRAMFDDAVLHQAILTRANLLRGNFQRADLTGANLEGANAYGAGFWEAVTEDANFKDTNLRHTMLS